MPLSDHDLAPSVESDAFVVLCRCLRACAMAERGYASATEDARDPVMRAVFHVYERQRGDFVEALRDATLRLGVPDTNEVTSSVVTRAKPLERIGADDARLLDDVVRRETAAARIYATALRCTDVPAELRAMLYTQYEAIRDAVEDVLSRTAGLRPCEQH
jgi:hypothetical protein